MIKLLLVEDDPDMLDLTGYFLRRERFVVVEASDGAQAIRRWKVDKPNLVILDLGLPSLDGFEVLRRIREDGVTPVLIVSGRRDTQDIARAFNLGTDDFVLKPFDFRELVARIRAILRRATTDAQETTEPRVELSGLTLEPQTHEVGWRDRYVRITPTEFRILYLLATNGGRVVPASRMYTYVWGSGGGDANALRSHISHLRRKLEGDGDAPGTIEAIPAVGYIFRRSPARAGVPQTAPVQVTNAASAENFVTPARTVLPAGSAKRISSDDRVREPYAATN